MVRGVSLYFDVYFVLRWLSGAGEVAMRIESRGYIHSSRCESSYGPFLKVFASAIVDKYIGESARIIREMFGYAKDHQPCMIFMDEVDAIGGSRFSEGTSSDREIQCTLMELCTISTYMFTEFRFIQPFPPPQKNNCCCV